MNESIGGDILRYHEIIKIADSYLLPRITQLYELEGYEISRIGAHEGGRNIAYNCANEGHSEKIIRITYLSDRSKEDLLGEVEYIRYLFEHGGSVSNLINSSPGNLLEEISYENHSFFICLFEKARGKLLVEDNYRYREGVPITEYYYNCGKTLGKLHQLSKGYKPTHPRYSILDKYNDEYIHRLIPNSCPLLQEKLIHLITMLGELDRNQESYGMVHFDYNDGNYMIDYDTGKITVFDFDNSCYCWYLYDLADLWVHGLGWIQFEPDVTKRRKFMEEYFETVLAGYQSETNIDQELLAQLTLFIQVVLMESIVDYFEVKLLECKDSERDEPMEKDSDLYLSEFDEEISYLIKCMEEDIPYWGFFQID